MPDMDGLGFARSIRSGGPWAHLPVIALTAHADAHFIQTGREAGFTGIVAKMERESLIDNLRACLAEPAAA